LGGLGRWGKRRRKIQAPRGTEEAGGSTPLMTLSFDRSPNRHRVRRRINAGDVIALLILGRGRQP
jgi:hypothetical protein